MLKTIEGFYQNGQIQLTEIPQLVSDRTQVLVTFLEPGKTDPSKIRQLIDQLETIAGIQQGFEELEAGKTRPIGDFIEEMQQIENAYRWYRENNPEFGDRWFREIMNAIATLQEKPRRCSLAVEHEIFSEEVRQLLHGKSKNVYRILFTIRDMTVDDLKNAE
jgi:plasmid stabilization system protein ParE